MGGPQAVMIKYIVNEAPVAVGNTNTSYTFRVKKKAISENGSRRSRSRLGKMSTPCTYGCHPPGLF